MEMKFEKPELKIIRFDVKDVLTASGAPSESDEVPPTTDEWETHFIPNP